MQVKTTASASSERSPAELDRFGMPTRARSRTAVPADEAPDRPQTAIFAIFVTLAVSITFLQKFGIGATPESVVPLVVPVAYAALIAGVLFAGAALRPMRMALYLTFILVSALITVATVTEYSASSLALYAALYLPLVVTFPSTRATFRRCMRFYCDLALVFIAIEAAQHLVQLAIGASYWPNLDALLPANILIPGYVYIQPIVWGMAYLKPNAVFFLEVSYLSQYLAMALIIEILMFQRIWRMALYAGGVFATFAGTGPLLLLIVSPLLIFGTTRLRSGIVIMLTVLLVIALASYLGWFDLVAHRLDEFQRGGTSANMRFVEPLNRIVQSLADPAGVYSGIGPGMIEKSLGFQWWPITKAVVEYGLIAAILFYVFFTHAIFSAPPNRRLAICVFIWFSLEGSLLTAINPLSCMLFVTMFGTSHPSWNRGSGERAARERPAGARGSGQPGRAAA